MNCLCCTLRNCCLPHLQVNGFSWGFFLFSPYILRDFSCLLLGLGYWYWTVQTNGWAIWYSMQWYHYQSAHKTFIWFIFGSHSTPNVFLCFRTSADMIRFVYTTMLAGIPHGKVVENGMDQLPASSCLSSLRSSGHRAIHRNKSIGYMSMTIHWPFIEMAKKEAVPEMQFLEIVDQLSLTLHWGFKKKALQKSGAIQLDKVWVTDEHSTVKPSCCVVTGRASVSLWC